MGRMCPQHPVQRLYRVALSYQPPLFPDQEKEIAGSGAVLPSNLETCPVVGLIQIPYSGQLSSESCPKYSLGRKSVAIGQEPSIKSGILEICPLQQWTKWNRDHYQPMCQLTETAPLSSLHVHPTFHVSQLNPYSPIPLPLHCLPTTPDDWWWRLLNLPAS